MAEAYESYPDFRSYLKLAAQGRIAEAEPFARRALEIGEQEFGPDHRHTATLLGRLARLYRKLDRAGAAEPLLKRAWAIRGKASTG